MEIQYSLYKKIYWINCTGSKPVLSELISGKTKNDDTLDVNYTELIPVLIKAVQEQQVIIESLKKRIEKLEKDR